LTRKETRSESSKWTRTQGSDRRIASMPRKTPLLPKSGRSGAPSRLREKVRVPTLSTKRDKGGAPSSSSSCAIPRRVPHPGR
jgi:hypothetical protein